MTHTSRPVTIADRGVVASPHYLASQAGLQVLRDGGNAVDAAVATSTTLHVVMPQQCSVGGDAFWLIYEADTQRLRGLNASGRSSLAISGELLRDRGFESMPIQGAVPVTVPGSVDGYCTALEAFGSLSLEEVLQPAIHYAEDGFPVNVKLRDAITRSAETLNGISGWKRVFMPAGQVPSFGERLVQKDLAETLRMIASDGRDAFYEGELADRIVSTVQSQGGYLTARDMQRHHSDWVEPVTAAYRGRTVCGMPPNSRGAITLMALNILNEVDVPAMGFLSPESIHWMVEAYRVAKEAFEAVAGDPTHVDVPLRRLLSEETSDQLRTQVRSRCALDGMTPDREVDGNTVYISVCDSKGNAVSLIDSTYCTFGSGIVVQGAGFTLQNRGAYFSLDPDHPNHLAPHKRTIHTLSPSFALNENKPWLVFGTMGGDGQPQTQMQILTAVIDFGLNIQEAIETPRWVLGGTLVNEDISALRMEDRLATGRERELCNYGYNVVRLGPWSDRVGVAQAVLVDGHSGMFHGGADPRGEGAAVGW